MKKRIFALLAILTLLLVLAAAMMIQRFLIR